MTLYRNKYENRRTRHIYWFRPENNVLLMLIDNQFARNDAKNEIMLRVLYQYTLLVVTKRIGPATRTKQDLFSFSNIL